MRGLVSVATLLWAPSLVWATAKQSPKGALVTLDLLTESAKREQVQLLLDVWTHGAECDGAIVETQGLALGRSPADGYGSLLKLYDGTVGGSWSYNCMLAEDGRVSQQVLFVTVDTLNREQLAVDAKFAITFRHDPPEILAIHGAEYDLIASDEHTNRAVTEYTRMANGYWPLPQKEMLKLAPAKEVDQEHMLTNELKLLRGRVHELRKLVAIKAQYLWKEYGSDAALIDPYTSHPHSWSPSANDKADHGSQQTNTFITTKTQDQREHPLPIVNQESTTSILPHCQETPISSQLSSLLMDEDLFTVLGVAAIFFGLLSLCGISFLHRRLLALKSSGRRHRRTWRGFLQRETAEERRARRAARWEARREAIQTWFRNAFARFFSGDEEKQAMLQQRQTEAQRPAVIEEDQTTMEQEIARFREAATMVGDLIAAEEGRSQDRPQQRVQPAVPRRSQASAEYRRISEDEEFLPAYEEASAGIPVVADGYRYTPGSSEFIPSTTSNVGVSDSNSDRLGYNK